MKAHRVISRATLLLAILAGAFVSVAQEKAGPPQTSEPIRITKVEFVSEYRIGDTTVTALPDKVIAVVQTNRKWEPPAPKVVSDVAWMKLDNYVFQYTVPSSKTGSVSAIAVGNQQELPSGNMLQLWVHKKQGSAQQNMVNVGGQFVPIDGDLITSTVLPSQYISGLTVLAALPKNVTSFVLSFKEIAYVSEPIHRDPEK